MSVLTKKYRPNTYEEVIGQEVALRLLRSISMNPGSEKAPKSMILYGEWGTGKTTCARIFGRALSCHTFSKTGKVCMKCEGCREFEKVSNRYQEYDSAAVGNVQQVKDLKPLFDLYTDYYRVIVFDECHLISRAAQSAMLKIVEEGNPKTFFLFVTTEYDKVLKTIQSRSLPVEFFKVDYSTIKSHLRGIVVEEHEDDVSDAILERIAFKSDGHVRDAVMLLSGYLVSRDVSVLNVPVIAVQKFFMHLGKGSYEGSRKAIDEIMSFPLHQVKRSINFVVYKLVEGEVSNSDDNYGKISRLFKGQVITIFKYISDVASQGVFVDKFLTMSFFLTLVRAYTKK